VILCAYRAFSLELLSHDRGDFARFLVARTNHERRFTGLKSREMLFDGSFPQFCSICKLFDDSVLFQIFARRSRGGPL
jgi:hypothetical protein